MNITDYIDARRREVETALADILPPTPSCPDVLHNAMRYSLLAGGKRLRPILCLASADAVGGNRADALPAACAIEMIHTYSLIHDDLPAMDNDTMRRGRPTLHVVAGEGQAILAGDGLLTEAFVVLARARPSDYSRALDHLGVIQSIASAAGAMGMVGGQAMDLACMAPGADGTTAPPLDADELRRMYGKKTGALIAVAATSGAIMGGGSYEQIRAIGDAAADFGLAFQIVDDVLDVEGASGDLGKTAGKDAATGKLTYPALYGLTASKQMAADCLEHAAATLRDAGITDPHLLAIGQWVVNRKN